MTRAPLLPSRPPASPGADTLQRAIDAMNAGRWMEAEANAHAVLALRPNDPTALNILGGAAMHAGRYTDAIAVLKKAAIAQPKNPFIAFNLGESFRRADAPADSLQHYKKALKLKPEFAGAHGQMGEALRALGRDEDAAKAYQAGLKHDPKLMVAFKGLGFLYMRQGAFSEAANCFTQARTLTSDATAKSVMSANLGAALLQAGAHKEALEALSEAMAGAPENPLHGRVLAQALRNTRIVPTTKTFRDQLLALFKCTDIDPRALATAAVVTLKDTHREPTALLQDPLLRALLASTPIPDADLEQILAARRRDLLLGPADAQALSFICALARQCFLNEYVYSFDDVEDAALTRLEERLRTAPDWYAVALLACYKRLDQTTAKDLDYSAAPADILALRHEQIEQPAREQVLRESLPKLGALTDTTSVAVQQQYEEHPYPRWTRCQLYEPMPFRTAVRSMLPYLTDAEIADVTAPQILIAGCGTCHEIMRAVTTYKNANVLGVDLSRVSLAYGARKLEEYAATNARLLHGDILDLGKLTERFDLVESFGVLHHMRDTEQGLRSVRAVVKSGGLLRIGLYSEIGRAGVVAARNLIAARKYPSDAAGIRRLRHELMTARELPPELEILKSPASDFWTTSECRDLMFHVQEHRFTLLQIEAMLARLELTFLGLETRHAIDRTRFAQMYPDPAAARSLAAWHAYETQHPEAFGETYQLWLKRT